VTPPKRKEFPWMEPGTKWLGRAGYQRNSHAIATQANGEPVSFSSCYTPRSVRSALWIPKSYGFIL